LIEQWLTGFLWMYFVQLRIAHHPGTADTQLWEPNTPTNSIDILLVFVSLTAKAALPRIQEGPHILITHPLLDDLGQECHLLVCVDSSGLPRKIFLKRFCNPWRSTVLGSLSRIAASMAYLLKLLPTISLISLLRINDFQQYVMFFVQLRIAFY
jgi:hypothetical protein